MELTNLRKGDEPKAILAALPRRRTAVSTEGIDRWLHMGHPAAVSRQVGIVKRDHKLHKQVNELE